MAAVWISRCAVLRQVLLDAARLGDAPGLSEAVRPGIFLPSALDSISFLQVL